MHKIVGRPIASTALVLASPAPAFAVYGATAARSVINAWKDTGG